MERKSGGETRNTSRPGTPYPTSIVDNATSSANVKQEPYIDWFTGPDAYCVSNISNPAVRDANDDPVELYVHHIADPEHEDRLAQSRDFPNLRKRVCNIQFHPDTREALRAASLESDASAACKIFAAIASDNAKAKQEYDTALLTIS